MRTDGDRQRIWCIMPQPASSAQPDVECLAAAPHDFPLPSNNWVTHMTMCLCMYFVCVCVCVCVCMYVCFLYVCVESLSISILSLSLFLFLFPYVCSGVMM